MKKRRLSSALASLAACIHLAHAAPTPVVRDDAGQTLTLPAPAQRIISLSPHLTELAFSAGAGSYLVGVVDYSDAPPPARTLPHIGNSQGLDLEGIAALHPDLILAWQSGQSARVLKPLKALGIPILMLATQHLSDIPDDILRIATLTHTENQARTAANDFTGRLQALKNQYAKRAPITVFYQIADQPLLSINRTHIVDEVIQLCGGNNVFATHPQTIALIAVEDVIAAQPQILLHAITGHPGNTPQESWNNPALNRWRSFATLPATQQQQYWGIPADEISRPGPRILQGIEAVCTALDSARAARR